MKTGWKKLLSLLLVLSMTLSLMPAVFSEGEEEELLAEELETAELFPEEELFYEEEGLPSDDAFPEEADESLAEETLADEAVEAVTGDTDAEAVEDPDVEAEIAGEPAETDAEAAEEISLEDELYEEIPFSDVLAEVYLSKDFIGFPARLENVFEGYDREDGIVRIYLAGPESRITVYADAAFFGIPMEAGWLVTGEQIQKLTAEDNFVPADGELWLTVDEVEGLRTVNAADYAADPLGSYVVFSVAEEGGFLDLTLDESDAFTVMAEIAADEAAEAESVAAEAEAEDAQVEETEAEGEEAAMDAADVAMTPEEKELKALFESAAASMRLDREYMLLETGSASVTLNVIGLPEKLADHVDSFWSIETADGNPSSGVVTVDESTGAVTAREEGSCFVAVTFGYDKSMQTVTLRCRVDVVDGRVADKLVRAGIKDDKTTVELYSTQYTQIDVLLELASAAEVGTAAAKAPTVDAPAKNEDTGLAIQSAEFKEGSDAATYFDLRVVDDRTLEIIPKQAAFDNAAKLRSCKGEITVYGDGWAATTTKELNVTVKKTLPKVKIAAVKFNTFNLEESQAVVFTGATVLEAGFDKDNPKNTNADKVAFNCVDGEATLTLTKAAQDLKSFSGKLNLKLALDGWVGEYDTVLSFSASRKAPKMLISPAKLTLNPDAKETVSSVAVVDSAVYQDSEIVVSSVLFNRKSYTPEQAASELHLDIQTAPNETGGYAVSVSLTEGFDPGSAKTFTVNLGLKRTELETATELGKLTVATLTGKNLEPSMKAKATGSINLKVAGSPVTITVTPKNFSTADYALSFVKVEKNGEAPVADASVFVPKKNGNTITLTANPAKAPEAGTYKVTVSATVAGTAIDATATFTVIDKAAAPAVTLKAKGNIDVIRPETAITITPSMKNWYGHDKLLKSDLVFCTGTGRKAKPIEADLIPFAVTVDEAAGAYVVTVADADIINHKTVYSVHMKNTDGTIMTANPLKLNVRMGSAKFSQSTKTLTLFRNDPRSYDTLFIAPTDSALSEIDHIDLVANKASAPFAKSDLGSGSLEIHFKDDTVTVPARTKSANLSLKVFLKGNNSSVANGTIPVKVNISDVKLETAVEKIAPVINENVFPDETFRTLVQSYDKDGDGKLSDEEIALVTEIDCPGQGITSLKGIEIFTALEKLNCSDNALTELDVHNNRKLTVLDCSANAQMASCLLPASLTEIQANAFKGNTALKSIELPASVTKIGESAFEGCTSLVSVVMANAVTAIGKAAFKGCSSLSSMKCF